MGLLYLLLFEYLDCLWLLRRGSEFVGHLQSECSHHDDPYFHDAFFDFRARDFPRNFCQPRDELDKLCGGNCSRTWCDDGSGRAQNLWKIEIKKWLTIRLLAILGGLHNE